MSPESLLSIIAAMVLLLTAAYSQWMASRTLKEPVSDRRGGAQPPPTAGPAVTLAPVAAWETVVPPVVSLIVAEATVDQAPLPIDSRPLVQHARRPSLTHARAGVVLAEILGPCRAAQRGL